MSSAQTLAGSQPLWSSWVRAEDDALTATRGTGGRAVAECVSAAHGDSPALRIPQQGPEWDTRETERASRTPTFSMGLPRPNGSGAVDLPPGKTCPGCLAGMARLSA